LPLSEKTRIEIFLPDFRKPAYRDLLDALDREFTHAFGGATTVYGLDGSYLSRAGLAIRDRINLVYTDIPFGWDGHFDDLSNYADELREAAFRALDEEAVLVVLHPVWHSAPGSHLR
jgi:hypothetical protein